MQPRIRQSLTLTHFSPLHVMHPMYFPMYHRDFCFGSSRCSNDMKACLERPAPRGGSMTLTKLRLRIKYNHNPDFIKFNTRQTETSSRREAPSWISSKGAFRHFFKGSVRGGH